VLFVLSLEEIAAQSGDKENGICGVAEQGEEEA
jgi:hypothetical protein